MNMVKWRNLHVHLRNIFQACPMLRHAIDKNAVHSAALSFFGRKTNKTAD